jgi:hypothetical protein
MMLCMSTTAEPAVLDRLLEPLVACLTPAVARKILKLRADPVARARVDDLARRYSAGLLTFDEQAEYRTYVSAGTFIAVLQSKARRILAQKSRCTSH